MSVIEPGQPIGGSNSSADGVDSPGGAGRLTAEQPPIQPAATVMLLRRGTGKPEVLLVRRSERLVFGPGYWVFPGGRLDPADYSAAGGGGLWRAARHAAAREVREETRLCVTPSALLPLSIWITPPGYPRRFRAYFFVCEAAEAQSVRVDGEEIVDYRWMSAAAALEDFHADALPLMVPTRRTLEKFVACDAISDCLAQCQAGAIQEFTG
jgi:8-oxo-dGTP pyrophosphatase MutT (NUDIX family)